MRKECPNYASEKPILRRLSHWKVQIFHSNAKNFPETEAAQVFNSRSSLVREQSFVADQESLLNHYRNQVNTLTAAYGISLSLA